MQYGIKFSIGTTQMTVFGIPLIWYHTHKTHRDQYGTNAHQLSVVH